MIRRFARSRPGPAGPDDAIFLLLHRVAGSDPHELYHEIDALSPPRRARLERLASEILTERWVLA